MIKTFISWTMTVKTKNEYCMRIKDNSKGFFDNFLKVAKISVIMEVSHNISLQSLKSFLNNYVV